MDHDSDRLHIWGEHATTTRTAGPQRTVFEQQDRARALRALTKGRSVVYALQLADGCIKIGCSRNLDARRRHYPGAQVIGFRFGNEADELAIHRSLRESVARGREYYHATPEVVAVVNDMRDDFGLPHIAA